MLTGCAIVFGFVGWGYWHAVIEAPAVSYHTDWGSNTIRRLTVLLASFIVIPLAGWVFKLGLRRQLAAADADTGGAEPEHLKSNHKSGWHYVIEGLGLMIICGLIIATALAWWNSIPTGYGDRGMGPIAVFLGSLVLAFPVGALLLIGGSGVIYGAIRSLGGLSAVIASKPSS
jgi:hypothetical protein